MAATFVGDGGASAVGVLGNGKRGYLDAALEFRGVPSHLVGRPYVMTASADADSQVFKGFMSLYVDEPTDLYILVPPDQRESFRAHTGLSRVCFNAWFLRVSLCVCVCVWCPICALD
eukprot:3876476-Rhodomonas_salina.3